VWLHVEATLDRNLREMMEGRISLNFFHIFMSETLKRVGTWGFKGSFKIFKQEI